MGAGFQQSSFSFLITAESGHRQILSALAG